MGLLSKAFNSKALKNLVIGTTLTATMVGGMAGLATPHEAHAINDTQAIILGLGAAAAGAMIGNQVFNGGSHGGGAGMVDPSCGYRETQTNSYGMRYGGTTSRTINCPPRAAAGAHQRAPQQVFVQPQAPQQVVVQQSRSSGELEKELKLLESLRHERQMLERERDAEFYKSAPAARTEQAANFCMKVTKPESLDAANRKNCGAILSRTEEGRAFLERMGRTDLMKAQDMSQRSGDDAGAGALCATETIKESYDAAGKMTGRTIEKTTKPCNPKPM